MNIEEQALDLCNVKMKSNVDDNTTNNSEEIIPRISELMDGDLCKQGIGTEVADTSSLARLTDNPRGEDNHRSKETLEIDEVNGNKNNSVPDTPAIVSSDFAVSNDDQDQEESIKDTTPSALMFAIEEGDDGGDMDISVDLSLDESGMLESEPTDQGPSLTEETFSSGTNPDSSTPDVVTDKEPDKPSEQEDSPPVIATGEALSPALDEGDDKHKNGKRVTFPSDEDIVSGAVEPKDPWRHAQNVTVDEILSAYRQACVKLNCKLIPKVLKQMQELKDLTHRNECLDLKGEKLDYKACESLEEVFKRVQFKVVDLEQTSLDEDGASALFDMIEYYESATHLNISFNKHIGTRGWQAAAHMMRKTSSLQYLDARNTPLLDHSAPFVARALRISGSLAVLHLENAGLSGRPLMLLATALKMNMNLRELYLADNKLNGLQDSAQLGNLLKFNCNIQILDLRNNHILDSGLAYVCEGLKEQRKGLVTLVLWNNQLTHNGMGYLAAALPCTQSLETLNLGHNSVGNEGVHKLKDGLISNRSVLRLGLASTKLSCEGAVAVAEFIAESPRLLRLDLRENEIKTGGLMALSLALKVNTSLLRLDLDREPKKETVKSFIDTQRSLLAEIQNGCKRNFILAKEKEETEQQMHSASMAEIATEDRTEEEDGADSGEHVEKDGEDSECEGGKEGVKDTESLTDSQSAVRSEGIVLPLLLESDSDTDDDEEEEVVLSKAPSVSPVPKHTGPSLRAATTQHPLSASQMPTAPFTPPATGAFISGITVTESTGPPGTPPSPGRCISVSSPGRGHKIFMVTRVESPSDQQQVLGKIGMHNPKASKEPVVSLVKQTTHRPQAPSQPSQEEVRTEQTQPQTMPTPLTQEVRQSLTEQTQPQTTPTPLTQEVRQSLTGQTQPQTTPLTQEVTQSLTEQIQPQTTPLTQEVRQSLTGQTQPQTTPTPLTQEVRQSLTGQTQPQTTPTPLTQEVRQSLTGQTQPQTTPTPLTQEVRQSLTEQTQPQTTPTPLTQEVRQSLTEQIQPQTTPLTQEVRQSLTEQTQPQTTPTPLTQEVRQSLTEQIQPQTTPLTQEVRQSLTEQTQPQTTPTPLTQEVTQSLTEQIQPQTTPLTQEVRQSLTEQTQPQTTPTPLTQEVRQSLTEQTQPQTTPTPLTQEVRQSLTGQTQPQTTPTPLTQEVTQSLTEQTQPQTTPTPLTQEVTQSLTEQTQPQTTPLTQEVRQSLTEQTQPQTTPTPLTQEVRQSLTEQTQPQTTPTPLTQEVRQSLTEQTQTQTTPTPLTQEVRQSLTEQTQPQTTPLTRGLVQSLDEPQTIDPKQTEKSPVAPEEPSSEEDVVETPNDPSETLEPPSNLLTQPTEEEVEGVLDSSQPVLAEQSPGTAAQPSHTLSLPTEDVATQSLASPQQTEQMVETATEPRLEQSAVEQQSTEAALEGEVVVGEKEASQDPVEETFREQAESQTNTEEDEMQSERLPQQEHIPEQASDTVQQPLAPQPLAPQLAMQTNTKPLGDLLLTAPLQSQPETVQPDSELLPPEQEPAETLPQAHRQVVPESPSEQGATESVAEAEQELYLSEEEQQQLAQQALPVQVEQQQQQPVLEQLQQQPLQPEGQSQTTLPAKPSPVPAETDTALEVEGCSSPPKAEESPDESSTDEGESVEEVVGSALPNGLKPEFVLHLLDPEGPKPGPGSCVMEHVSVTAELSCGQDLEELLLEASLETGRDAP
ncbi:protein phosphatase 1 regulatory subunit 37-like isoform X6 [Salvelinus namaycush]|uniref:Protein phosphatase 1 regulatory subunit 37 n=1 Tax=Salvelinus namaycush TaxID=8040 RepID=A0A8U0PRU1_SALNM|nr:protein phosphatase 1 regulatory subunit 37-like isoform X6 [Salvelinus namaycush]